MSRIITNSYKHIRRSGWVGVGSVFVMTLSFFIISVFSGLAYVSDLNIRYFESRNNIIVFFDVGTDQEVINRLHTKWAEIPEIKSIEYTSEEDAYDLYSDYASRVLRDIYQVLIEQEEKKLPSSLDIQLHSLKELDSVERILRKDIDAELKRLEVVAIPTEEVALEDENSEDLEEVPTTEANPSDVDEDTVPDSEADTTADEETDEQLLQQNSLQDSAEELNGVVNTATPIELAVDSESINEQVEAFSYLRAAGFFVIAILFIVVFFLTFMTVEFRLYNQMEEIGVMQLVGGSLTFIRAPYIIEGGVYGFLGALASSTLLLTVYYLIFVMEVSASLSSFLYDNFSGLPWPEFGYLHLAGLVGGFVLVGFFMGAMSSYLSIRRYIR